LAYFEEKALRHAKESKLDGRENEMINKLKFNFNRISSLQARKIAQPFYDEAMEVLS